MIEIIIPVYDQEHFYALEALYELPADADIKVTIIDDSVDQNIKWDHRKAAPINYSCIRNGGNKGTLVSRLQAVYQSTGDFIYFLDADDLLDYTTLQIALASMSSLISMMTTACYNCSKMGFDLFTNRSYDDLRMHPIERSTKIVGSLWRGADLRKCVFELLNSSLYRKLTKICNTNKIVLQEDEFFWMWCKCWMYNNKRTYCYSWFPTFYYNQYQENKESKDYKPINPDSEDYKERHDKWWSLLKQYWKF